jgi:myo-inositol-1(or 4)-monophosphatase
VAGNPKVYGQLVQLLAPYTRVIPADSADATPPTAAATPPAALATAASAPAAKKAVRARKAGTPREDGAPF